MNEKQEDQRKKIGRLGEQFAKDYLIQQGYVVLEQNWYCKTGEIDLIAHKDETLVFIEVRTRRLSNSFGNPSESVNYRKQQKIIKLSQYYLLKHPFDGQYRFDVIAIDMASDLTIQHLNHISNAF